MSDNGLAEFDARNAGADTFSPPVPARAPTGQATQIEQARAIAEVRAAVMIAMDRPRDRTAAMVEMREVCGILSLAERAFFRVPRGGEHVNGESIHLARELARCWGNIGYGVKELARDDIRGQSELVAFAWDLQTNARSEITFIVPHVRGRKNTRLTGTQEIYENNASFAGRRLREAIFAVLPVWFKAEAAEICHQTLRTGGGKPFIQQLTEIRLAFDNIGVTAAQLELKRGRRIDAFTPEDAGALRVIYGSLKRGEVTVAEEFPSGDQQPPPERGDKLGAIERATTATPTSPAGDPQQQPNNQKGFGATDGTGPLNHSDQPAGDATGSRQTSETPAASDGPAEPEHAHSAPRAGGAERIPERATAVDPEPKPPEAHTEAVDGAGSSSEADPAARGGGPAASRSRMPGDTGTPGRAGGAGGSPAPRSDPRPWQQRFDALKPDDLLGEPNWMDYADAAIALIGEATNADLSGLRLTGNPHMTALRKNDGDSYRQITDAVQVRAKALAAREGAK